VSIRGSVAGAIDSLATIPGYSADQDKDSFIKILEDTCLAHNSHTNWVAPADRILWELRDRTGTKKEPYLIAASLLGKKIAVGAANGTVDVRVGAAGNAGSSADEALETAYSIVGAAQDLGLRITCVLSDASLPGWHRIGRIDSILCLYNIPDSTGLQVRGF
jgi:thymidine phosphorylase